MRWDALVQTVVFSPKHKKPLPAGVHGSLAVTREACCCTSQRSSIPDYGDVLLGGHNGPQ